MNLVAYSYGMANLKAGDEILVSIMEHHSNILPWQMVSRATGAKLVFLECEPDGTITKEKMDAAFSEHTRMVAVTQVSNVLGCVNDIPELVKRARACGAAILMDAAQSAPHMPLTCRNWTWTLWRSPVIRCWHLWVSACCTASRNCWKRCRRF